MTQPYTSEIVSKECPSCKFVLKGEHLKWNGCPSCREPFFQYDAMQQDTPVKAPVAVLGVSCEALCNDDIVDCPECSGSGYGAGYYIDRHGDMQDDLCQECFGSRKMTREEHDHIIARNPELAFRLSCLDLIAERLRA